MLVLSFTSGSHHEYHDLTYPCGLQVDLVLTERRKREGCYFFLVSICSCVHIYTCHVMSCQFKRVHYICTIFYKNKHCVHNFVCICTR